MNKSFVSFLEKFFFITEIAYINNWKLNTFSE